MRKVMILAPLALLLAVAVAVGACTSTDTGDRASGASELVATPPAVRPGADFDAAVEAPSATGLEERVARLEETVRALERRLESLSSDPR